MEGNTIWKIAVRVFGLLVALMVAASASYGGSLDSSVIGMFPKDVGAFGCVDLAEAHQLPWFPQFEAQLVPVALYGFEQFLAAAQLRQTSSIEEVAWARVAASKPDSSTAISTEASSTERTPVESPADGNGQLVAVATGDFDEGAIQLALKSAKVASVQIGNYVLYDAGTGSGASNVFFALVDWRTIAFGPLPQLKRILGVHAGDEDNLLENETMMTLIDQTNGEGIFWGVLDSAHVASVIGQFVPEAANFPQSRDMIAKMRQLVITVKAPSAIEVDLQAASPSGDDAVIISQLLQAGILLRRYQTSVENNPELAKLLETVSISASGNRLDVSMELTNEQLASLIEHNTFALE